MKPTTVIRKQLTTTELVNGACAILRNGDEIGHLHRERSAYGLCYEVELFGKATTAASDIPNALAAAAVHIWRAEAAFDAAEIETAADDREKASSYARHWSDNPQYSASH